MDEKEIVDCIRNYFERNNGWEFAHELNRYKLLYEHRIPKKDFKRIVGKIRFESDSNGFLWKEDYSFRLIEDIERNPIYRFENDFKVSGMLTYWIEGSTKENKTSCSFSLTLRAHKYPDYTSIQSNHIELWTEEQKIINHFNDLIYAKYDALKFKSPFSNFDKFTEIWSSVDRTDNDQVKATSFHYFYELVHCFDHVMYLVTNANLYQKYTTNYTEKESHSPNGKFYAVNLTFYDRRYLDFCSLGFEKIYTFWERVAFLLFQFVKPTSLNEKQLSFAKLVKSLKEDIKKGHFSYLKNPASNFIWFCNFQNNEHKKLTAFRHPAIHYQKNNPIYKGGLYAGTHNYWLDNNGSKAKLEKLQKENENFCKFLNDQLKTCEVGLIKVVELIKEIPSPSKTVV